MKTGSQNFQRPTPGCGYSSTAGYEYSSTAGDDISHEDAPSSSYLFPEDFLEHPLSGGNFRPSFTNSSEEKAIRAAQKAFLKEQGAKKKQAIKDLKGIYTDKRKTLSDMNKKQLRRINNEIKMLSRKDAEYKAAKYKEEYAILSQKKKDCRADYNQQVAELNQEEKTAIKEL